MSDLGFIITGALIGFAGGYTSTKADERQAAGCIGGAALFIGALVVIATATGPVDFGWHSLLLIGLGVLPVAAGVVAAKVHNRRGPSGE